VGPAQALTGDENVPLTASPGTFVPAVAEDVDIGIAEALSRVVAGAVVQAASTSIAAAIEIR